MKTCIKTQSAVAQSKHKHVLHVLAMPCSKLAQGVEEQQISLKRLTSLETETPYHGALFMLLHGSRAPALRRMKLNCRNQVLDVHFLPEQITRLRLSGRLPPGSLCFEESGVGDLRFSGELEIDYGFSRWAWHKLDCARYRMPCRTIFLAACRCKNVTFSTTFQPTKLDITDLKVDGRHLMHMENLTDLTAKQITGEAGLRLFAGFACVSK